MQGKAMIHTDYCASRTDQPCDCGAAQYTEAEQMLQRYHNVFSTVEGRKVLGNILVLGRFGEVLDPNSPAQIGAYNLVITIANMSGVLDLVKPQLGITAIGGGNLGTESEKEG